MVTPSIPRIDPALRFAARATLVLAVLVVATSLGGLLVPDLYARETAGWREQSIGQDVVDLVLAVPALVISGLAVLRGRRRAAPLLAGTLAFTAYTFVIYGFALHFNPMFLVYCATLGVAVFALAASLLAASRAEATPARPGRIAGGFLVTSGVLFALAWLSDVIPALASGASPRTVVEAGVLVNPVHVIDLSTVLPLMIAAGVSLWRRGTLGRALGPVLLAFAALMAASIAGMMLVMRSRGVAPASLGVAAGIAGLAALSSVLLARQV
jgi:hypothetical protein